MSKSVRKAQGRKKRMVPKGKKGADAARLGGKIGGASGKKRKK